MLDNQIKEALKEFEIYTHIEINGKRLSTRSIEVIKQVLEKYLQASEVMPRKNCVPDFAKGLGMDFIQMETLVKGRDCGIDDCTFSLMKKMEGIEEVIHGFRYCDGCCKELSTAIKEYLMGREK